MNFTETLTDRGFKLITFKDRYNKLCSIQESSLATEMTIWFGVSDQTRMHLTRKQVMELLPILAKFVETGLI